MSEEEGTNIPRDKNIQMLLNKPYAPFKDEYYKIDKHKFRIMIHNLKNMSDDEKQFHLKERSKLRVRLWYREKRARTKEQKKIKEFNNDNNVDVPDLVPIDNEPIVFLKKSVINPAYIPVQMAQSQEPMIYPKDMPENLIKYVKYLTPILPYPGTMPTSINATVIDDDDKLQNSTGQSELEIDDTYVDVDNSGKLLEKLKVIEKQILFNAQCMFHGHNNVIAYCDKISTLFKGCKDVIDD